MTTDNDVKKVEKSESRLAELLATETRATLDPSSQDATNTRQAYVEAKRDVIAKRENFQQKVKALLKDFGIEG